MAIATIMRNWQDFDILTVVQFGMFLFSGTFVPAEAYPEAVRVLIQFTPLFQGVELIRDITTGRPGPATLVHVAYLLALAAVGLAIAGRRMGKILCR
jgi:lipooligosaccharide transport system permease protein